MIEIEKNVRRLNRARRLKVEKTTDVSPRPVEGTVRGQGEKNEID